jgi:hypothetical protein
VNVQEVTAKATGISTEVLQNGPQECFQKLLELWKECVTTKGNYFEGNVA